MKELLSGVDTIIFDLGEVIIDLNAQDVLKEFERLTALPPQTTKRLLIDAPELYSYETGQIGEEEFLEAVNAAFGSTMSMVAFRHAWNLMIDRIPQERVKLLKHLRDHFRLFFLSNTNRMHELRFNELAYEVHGIARLGTLVDHAVYSHEIGLRKPDASIYEAVRDRFDVKPEKALFLDDKQENIDSALDLGFKAFRVAYPDQILGLNE